MSIATPKLPALLRSNAPLATAGRFEVRLAAGAAEVEQAQALRYRVFVEELGAHPPGLLRDPKRTIERDLFDPYCDHLIARDLATGETVGTYRMLLPQRARELGCLYADREFWLTRLDAMRPRLVELGRSCVAREYRNGAVIRLLWAGLAAYLAGRDVDALIGCASMSIDDGGHQAAALYRKLSRTHLAAESFRVWPRRRLELASSPEDATVDTPVLIKGYLRAGASLLGEPHLDESFCCADFPMMLSLRELSARYRRRFGVDEPASSAIA